MTGTRARLSAKMPLDAAAGHEVEQNEGGEGEKREYFLPWPNPSRTVAGDAREHTAAHDERAYKDDGAEGGRESAEHAREHPLVPAVFSARVEQKEKAQPEQPRRDDGERNKALAREKAHQFRARYEARPDDRADERCRKPRGFPRALQQV